MATTADEQFAIIVNGGDYAFFVRDDKGTAIVAQANSGPDGTWHHLVGVCDGIGSTLTFYIDGVAAASAGISGLHNGIINSADAVSIGAEDWAVFRHSTCPTTAPLTRWRFTRPI